MREQDIDGTALIEAKRWSEKRFRDQVEHYRKLGFNDRQILNAMIASRAMIDQVGSLAAMRAPRVQHKETKRKQSRAKVIDLSTRLQHPKIDF